MVAPSNRNRFNKLTVASLCLCVVISVYHSVSSGKILKQFIVKSSFEDAVAVLPGLGGSNTGEDVDDDLGFDDGMADKHEYQDDDDGDNNKDDDNVENEGSGDEEENTSIKVVSTEIKEIEASEETERKEEAVEEVATEEGTSHQQDNNKMNVLIFYPDDWRHDSIGSEKPYVLTPFLDQLAKEGIRFTQNAVTTSICWMSRATLWMGQYTSRHKSYKLKCPRFGSKENWKHSWVKLLQNSGYFIGHVGKWQYYTYKTANYFDWAKLFEGHHWETIYGGRRVHASDLAKEYALQFFEERPKDKNFVLSIAFYPPKPVGDGRAPGHQWSPTNETRKLYENVTIPEPETKDSYKKLPQFLHRGPAVGRFGQRYGTSEHFQASMKNYYALITGVDQACKEIVDKLKEEGLYNNTMIIFTTDNGMFHGAHGLAGKWYPYQESIRVPLIIYDPRMPKKKIGTLDDSFTLNVDLAETILGATGVKPDELMQGRDISDLYLPNKKNEYHDTASVKVEPWREEFFYEFPSPEEVFIPSSTALVRKQWKYIKWPAHDYEQLFNLEEDPLENNDLFNEMSVKPILDKLRERHDELKTQLHNTSYGPRDPSCDGFLDFLHEIQKAEAR
mmetsp:Transcript_19265/g.28858  ORF Transcript_19265/g.28858 Transcript_19265/m.28858 type:complete len:617 (+) Transcript_19265:117-1967(+)